MRLEVTPIRVQLLGKLRITCAERTLTSVSTNRLQSLMAYLVLHGHSPQSREYVASLMWPESGESQARTNLRQLIHHLRRAIPSECSLLEIDNHTVRWRSDPRCSIDVVEFETAVEQATKAESKGNFITAREALEQAARLYEDDLLPDLYDDWLQSRREELRQKHADVLGRLAALLESAGEYAAAIRHATRLVAVDPLREPSCLLLMRLYARANDRASALRVYHECMRALKRELGISPAPALQELFTQVLKSKRPPAQAVDLHARSETKPLELVGRTTEWECARECWLRVTEGDRHLLLIKGEPGVGKSRLAEELLGYCSQSPHATVARARCYLAQGGVAYGPVTDWLRPETMQFTRNQLHSSQLAQLARLLPEILVEYPEISPPGALSEGWQRRHLYEAVSAVFDRCPKPLFLLVDDLQWCDYQSFDWLHSFLQANASSKTLVVATVRPEEVRRDHPLNGLVTELQKSGLVSELVLQRLGPEESAALAVGVAGRDFDGAFLNELYRRTAGNPLFVVESVRAWLEGPESSSLPPRVQAVIAARLAQLTPPAYELAGLAAAIGRAFSVQLLVKATDWEEDSVSNALEELWERRIVELRREPASTDTYDFTHDLLREVAYSELSPIRRRSLHRRIARALKELYASEPATINALLAAHYEAAGMPDQAIQSLRAAAFGAKQRFADSEAADLIGRALRLCRDLPESAKRDREELELLVTLGPSLVTTRGYSAPEIGETYERGRFLSTRSGDRKHWFSLLSGAWLFHVVRGQLGSARRLGEECVTEALREGSTTLQMAGRFLLGSSLFHLGDLRASLEEIGHAAQLERGVCHPALALFAGPDLGVFCRAYLSHLYWYRGDAASAAEVSEESIRLARHVSHPFTLAIALDYAAMLNVYCSQGAAVLESAHEASAICQKYGFTYYAAWAEILEGWAIGVARDPGAGLTKLRHGIEALRATGAELRLPFYYGLLSEVAGLAGELGDALASIASAFAFQSKNGEVWYSPELHRIYGDVLRRSGSASEADLSYRRAIEAAKQIDAPLLHSRAEGRLLRSEPSTKSPNADLGGLRTLSERSP